MRRLGMPISYDNVQIGSRRDDFLVKGNSSVELIADIALEKVHYTYPIYYIEAYNLEVGILINFGSVSLPYKRFENQKYKNRASKSSYTTHKSWFKIFQYSLILFYGTIIVPGYVGHPQWPRKIFVK